MVTEPSLHKTLADSRLVPFHSMVEGDAHIERVIGLFVTPSTERSAVALIPERVAVMVTVFVEDEVLHPVAIPLFTVATSVSELLQEHSDVTSFVVPSEYVAVAVNDVLPFAVMVAEVGESVKDVMVWALCGIILTVV